MGPAVEPAGDSHALGRRGGLFEELRGALAVSRIDEEEPQLGLVARVQMVVERAEGMQGGVPATGERGRHLSEPGLGPVGR